MPQPDPREETRLMQEPFPLEDLIPYEDVPLPVEDWQGYDVELLNALLD